MGDGAGVLAGLVVGLYTRISDDQAGSGRGVARQEEDERALVAAAGGTVGGVYEENDTSAYRKRRVRLPDGTVVYRVIRPVWQRLLGDLRAGVVQAAVVYDLDRLARDPRDLEDAIEVVEHHRRPVVGVTGGFDLMTDNGRFAARILVAQANKASADTARRVARKHVEQQQNGVPTGGRRPFGWLPDKRTLDPGEAVEVRRMAERIASGWPIGAVVVDLNARGVAPSRAGAWVQSSVVGLLRNPRLAGLRARGVVQTDPVTGRSSRRLEVVRHPDGTPVVGQWEEILTVADWEAVQATLDARSAGREKRPGHNVWRHLLSGLVRCGECGKPMRGMSTGSRDRRGLPAFVYSCQSKALGGCGRVSRHGPKTDAAIVDAVLAKLELELAGAQVDPGEWAGAGELDAVTARITDLTAAWKAGQVSSSRYFAVLPDLEADERRLVAERGVHRAAAEVARTRPAVVRAEWADYPLTRRRQIIDDTLAAIIVHKAPRRGAPFDPDLLEPVWHTD